MRCDTSLLAIRSMCFSLLMMTYVNANAEIVKPFTFYSGTTAKASEVNQNFEVVYGELNRVTKSISIVDGSEGLVNINSSHIGIGGVPSSVYMLAVHGTVAAKEILVATSWADYVFDGDYSLPRIDDVKNYIAKNNRLPGFNSAYEIQKNGLRLGDTITNQQAKIEEYMLYIIDLHERLKESENGNIENKERIALLEDDNTRLEAQMSDILSRLRLLEEVSAQK